ncbi:hypothetical protein HK101_002757, partial [Irineochytrium annulatum]
MLTELCMMLPFNGGMATFARTAFGPFWGYAVGQCELGTYAITIAVNVSYMAYLFTSMGLDPNFEPLWWFLQALFVFAFQCTGNTRYFALLIAFSVAAFLLLPMSVLPVLNQYNPQHWAIDSLYLEIYSTNTTNATTIASTDSAVLFPAGLMGILFALPDHLCDLVGLETIAMAVEEARDGARTIPRAILLATVVYLVQNWGYLIFIPGMAPGPVAILEAAYTNSTGAILPLLSAYGIQENYVWNNVVFWGMTIVTAASTVMASTFAFTRLAAALAKTGYIPHVIASTRIPGSTKRIPWAACVFGVLVVTAICCTSYVDRLVGTDETFSVYHTISMCVPVYESLSYAITAAAYLYLKIWHPHLKRPFDVKWVVLTLSLVNLGVLLQQPQYTIPAYFVAAKLGVGLIFLFFHRKHLVMTEEETYIHDLMHGKGNLYEPVEVAAKGIDRTIELRSE